MGHRDDLLVTHNLSEGENHETQPYPRDSVRRASGFVLTGNSEVIPREGLPTTHQPRPRLYGRELGQKVEVPKRKITSAELC
jgi:hypothetical protein